MQKLMYCLILAGLASLLFLSGPVLAGEPKYTYEQVYDGRRTKLRIVVLDQTGFKLTTVLQKVFSPSTFKQQPKHMEHIHPSFWASPERGAVGFQSAFQF